MSKFIKYDTTLTDVTSFSANYDNRSLSGRPEFSAGNTYTTLTCGFSTEEVSGTQRTFEGYSFDSVESVLLSCTDNLNPFVSSGEFINWPISSFTSISTLCAGAVLSPPLSGFLYYNFTLNNYNSMSVTFPQITATGSIDVIPMNAAGYGSLVDDISTTITIN